jgi:hypothetical protein
MNVVAFGLEFSEQSQLASAGQRSFESEGNAPFGK